MQTAKRPSAGYFLPFLGMVFLLFMGLLVYTWVGSEKARPVMLDEKGAIRGTTGSQPR